MEYDFQSIREQHLPFPTPAQGYTRVQFLGTTGSGKTTLVRQLMGTDPSSEHFPSTSAAKTTTCDIEIIVAEGSFKAIVSFLPRNMIYMYVEECVIAAALAHIETDKIQEVVRKFLQHSEQKFRLSYLLGTLPSSEYKNSFSANEDEESEKASGSSFSPERQQQIDTLRKYIQEICRLSNAALQDAETQPEFPIDPLKKEERNAFLEDFLEKQLPTYRAFQDLIIDIMRVIESRFLLLMQGRLTYNEDGWPSYWTYTQKERSEFLTLVNQFSSNASSQFGRLLTPLVQGLRVRGPFQPRWREGSLPRLVLIDGEGLGHIFETRDSLSPSVTARFENVDAIVIVDSAQQPMQAAPGAALKTIVTSGHVSKLFVCFTHFENVDGINFSDTQDRVDHVQNSLDNTLVGLAKDKEIGIYSGSILRSRLENHVFFLSYLDQGTLPEDVSTQLNTLLHEFESMQQAVPEGVLQPVYEEKEVDNTLHKAVLSFREAWQGRLGLNTQSSRHPEHWAKIKALAKRPAKLGLDEYEDLRPVADLIREIIEHIKQCLDKPLTWEFAAYQSDEERQIVIDAIARDIYAQLHKISRQRLIVDRISHWQVAYARAGTGSTKVRANDVESIYSYAAPLLEEVAKDETDAFYQQMTDLIQNAIQMGGGKLLVR